MHIHTYPSTRITILLPLAGSCSSPLFCCFPLHFSISKIFCWTSVWLCRFLNLCSCSNVFFSLVVISFENVRLVIQQIPAATPAHPSSPLHRVSCHSTRWSTLAIAIAIWHFSSATFLNDLFSQ